MPHDPIRPHWYQLPPGATEVAHITMHLPHARACAMEYIYRAGRKDPVTERQDLEKARRWLDLEIEWLRNVGDPGDG